MTAPTDGRSEWEETTRIALEDPKLTNQERDRLRTEFETAGCCEQLRAWARSRYTAAYVRYVETHGSRGEDERRAWQSRWDAADLPERLRMEDLECPELEALTASVDADDVAARERADAALTALVELTVVERRQRRYEGRNLDTVFNALQQQRLAELRADEAEDERDRLRGKLARVQDDLRQAGLRTGTHSRDDGSMRLDLGRIVSLTSIEQYLTYEGLLAGIPTHEMNRRQIERLVAKHTVPDGLGTPYLIEPAERPIEVPPHIPTRGTPAKLPRVTCIAEFMSDRLLTDSRVWSGLNVIWFQDAFAFPIDRRVMEQIREIDWERHAVGWEP